MNRLFFAVVFLGVSSIPLCVQAMDRGEYYASVSSVQFGLAPRFRRLLSSCGAEASMIVDLQGAAESHGSLEDSLVRAFLGKSHFGQNVLYCLDARIERLESTDDLVR
tara:strand:+ start:280 stop:603 length:324 start_codon:yes stop_codon:yes gene_type:complete